MASSTFLAPLASSVREVLSGRTDGQSDIARAIAKPAGAPGWFAPGDAIWTVHGSVATFVGGIRSLYLQALHPLAMAGVDSHSTYREDPFGPTAAHRGLPRSHHVRLGRAGPADR